MVTVDFVSGTVAVTVLAIVTVEVSVAVNVEVRVMVDWYSPIELAMAAAEEYPREL